MVAKFLLVIAYLIPLVRVTVLSATMLPRYYGSKFQLSVVAPSVVVPRTSSAFVRWIGMVIGVPGQSLKGNKLK